METVLQKTVTLDIETTGLPPKGASYERDYMQYPHILSMAWKINDLPTVEYIVNNRSLIVPPSATAINGITQQMMDESKFDLFSVMCQFIMDGHGAHLCIGHNIFFDTSVIKANIMRLTQASGISTEFYREVSNIIRKEIRVDTCRASIGLGYGKMLKLAELHMQLFGVGYTGNHTAGQDVDATYRCYVELVKRGLIKVIL